MLGPEFTEGRVPIAADAGGSFGGGNSGGQPEIRSVVPTASAGGREAVTHPIFYPSHTVGSTKFREHRPGPGTPHEHDMRPPDDPAYWEAQLADLETSSDDVLGSSEIKVEYMGIRDLFISPSRDVEKAVEERDSVRRIVGSTYFNFSTGHMLMEDLLLGITPDESAAHMHERDISADEDGVMQVMRPLRISAGLNPYVEYPAEITFMRGDDPSDTLIIRGTEIAFEGGGIGDDKYRIRGEIGEKDVSLIRRPNEGNFYENWKKYKAAGLPVVPTMHLTPDRQTVVMTDLAATGGGLYGKNTRDQIIDGRRLEPELAPGVGVDEQFLIIVEEQMPAIEKAVQDIVSKANKAGLAMDDKDALELLVNPEGSWRVVMLDVELITRDGDMEIDVGKNRASRHNTDVKEKFVANLYHLAAQISQM